MLAEDAFDGPTPRRNSPNFSSRLELIVWPLSPRLRKMKRVLKRRLAPLNAKVEVCSTAVCFLLIIYKQPNVF